MQREIEKERATQNMRHGGRNMESETWRERYGERDMGEQNN